MRRATSITVACALVSCVYDLSPQPDSATQKRDGPLSPGPDRQSSGDARALDRSREEAASTTPEPALPDISWTSGMSPSLVSCGAKSLVSGGGACVSPGGLIQLAASPPQFSVACSPSPPASVWAACGDFPTKVVQAIAAGNTESVAGCVTGALVGGTCACSLGTIRASYPAQAETGAQSWRCRCTSDNATATASAICSTTPVLFKTYHRAASCEANQVLLAGGCACAAGDYLQISSYQSGTWECSCIGGATTSLKPTVICAGL